MEIVALVCSIVVGFRRLVGSLLSSLHRLGWAWNHSFGAFACFEVAGFNLERTNVATTTAYSTTTSSFLAYCATTCSTTTASTT